MSANIYLLSAYVYSALSIIQTANPEKTQTIQPMITRLEEFLSQYRTVDTLGAWWYLLTKVTNGKEL
ncbi:hypothetical protein KA405_06105 [Patescibacteria group bacterium]|nr:hypothetical protein [Patescibacteria group bacterium]